MLPEACHSTANSCIRFSNEKSLELPSVKCLAWKTGFKQIVETQILYTIIYCCSRFLIDRVGMDRMLEIVDIKFDELYGQGKGTE